ncbi:MAG: hypothetical protein OXC79_07735 [Candidatus Poribacteria bacterium]|nr:hypothetical protein [Candidatus Poribacteria bacterium]
MKINLGNKTIQISRIQRVRRVGNLAILTFKNGDSLKVVCGVNSPETNIPYFSGTYEDLKSLIERLK